MLSKTKNIMREKDLSKGKKVIIHIYEKLISMQVGGRNSVYFPKVGGDTHH